MLLRMSKANTLEASHKQLGLYIVCGSPGLLFSRFLYRSLTSCFIAWLRQQLSKMQRKAKAAKKSPDDQ